MKEQQSQMIDDDYGQLLGLWKNKRLVRSCLSIRFIAIVSDAPVRAGRPAPVWPSVAFARARKLKSPVVVAWHNNTAKSRPVHNPHYDNGIVIRLIL